MLNQGQAVGVRYKILERLGKGGFGETYLAEDIYLRGDRRCVVKLLQLNSTDPAYLTIARRLFDREADTLGELGNHNQIPRLLAHFEENQQFFLVQEFIDGHNLDAEIRLGVPKPESYALKLVWDILEVLTFVHQHDVIHRDLKPANIMRRNTDGKLVLIDFGAVKQVQQQIGSQVADLGQRPANTVIYTAEYAPPELHVGKPYPSSDIFSVGIIAIQALTGRPRSSFDEANGGLVWRNYAQVSPAFADVIDRMTRTQFYDRYQSVEAVIRDLEPLLFAATPQPSPTPELATTILPKHAPVSPVTKAQPDSATLYQPASTAHPKKSGFLLGIGTAIFLSLVGGGSYMALQWMNPEKNDQIHLAKVDELLNVQDDLYEAVKEANKISFSGPREEAKRRITEKMNSLEKQDIEDDSGSNAELGRVCFQVTGSEAISIWKDIDENTRQPTEVIGNAQPKEILYGLRKGIKVVKKQAWVPGEELEVSLWAYLTEPPRSSEDVEIPFKGYVQDRRLEHTDCPI